MKNWQTTLAGFIISIGIALKDQQGWLGLIGQGMVLLGPVLLGAAAADANKTTLGPKG